MPHQNIIILLTIIIIALLAMIAHETQSRSLARTCYVGASLLGLAAWWLHEGYLTVLIQTIKTALQ